MINTHKDNTNTKGFHLEYLQLLLFPENNAVETIFQGLLGVCVYFDDLLITGKSNEEYLVNLSAVLRRLATVGMKLK